MPRPVRVLFVFAWLVVGGEETEIRLLAKALDPSKYRLDIIACFRKPGMPDQTHDQLAALGIDVDRTPYALGFEETVDYLARKITDYDIVVSCQNVADIYPALERMHWRPPLIEHGGLVSEALAGPKHFTTRYVGVCRSIRDAAASRMPGRENHAIEIPSMVDLAEFTPPLLISNRARIRAELGISADTPLVGWVGRLDPKKRVEDFIDAAAIALAQAPETRFLIIGGPDAFLPDYAESLRARAARWGLGGALRFLGDRPDVPALLAALDISVWLSRGEGMPHVIAEAGAAGLPVIATADNGALQQIDPGISGLFVPHESPSATAAAILSLQRDTGLRHRLGTALRARAEATFATTQVAPRWDALFQEVLAERIPAPTPSVFASFAQGGFECSTHRRRDGRRLDVIAATGHDLRPAEDYIQLRRHGMRTVRDGLRWHLIEQSPGRHDWSSFLPMLRAARATSTEVIWDLLHYGWPDDLDIWSPAFVDRFAHFASEAARMIRSETDGTAFYCPVNEISFLAWGGGDAGYLNPFAHGRGFELKAQLARAAIAAMHRILDHDPAARFVHCEPAINIITDPTRPEQRREAEGWHFAQYQAFDMIAGRMWPQLGGTPRLLDIVGVNYYFDNQWIHGGPPIDQDHPLHRPLRGLLAEIFARYGRPLLIAETGIEGDRRAGWLRGMFTEVAAARAAGVPVEGLCLYPIIDHIGWDDDRNCPSGLLASSFVSGNERAVHAPLAAELRRCDTTFTPRPKTHPIASLDSRYLARTGS